MSDKKTNLEVATPKRDYVDPTASTRGGVSGVLETTLRRFKNLMHLILITPLYLLSCAMIGLAAIPGVALFEYLQVASQAQTPVLRYFILGFGLAAGFYAYGFSMVFIVPLVNFCARANLKPWRGPYYSLEAIRWYIHNAALYLIRYTFLEFITPSPFNILFYKMMGMKIGAGTAINTTNISDPSMIEMGEKVTIGGSVTIVAHYGQGGYLVLAPVKIGDKATIGLKATIMGGVTIGAGAKVMPNSVVMPKTEIPPGETWGGVPAKPILS